MTSTATRLPAAEVAMLDGPAARDAWLNRLDRVARPVLSAVAEGRLLRDLDRGDPPHAPDRERFLVLEALARTLNGLAPWLASNGGDDRERAARDELRGLALRAVASAADPASPGAATFDPAAGTQPIVDAATLCYAFLRAPAALWDPLAGRDKANVLAGLRLTRRALPARNNWLLFCAMTETWLRRAGQADWDPLRIDYALVQHRDRYAGDGLYLDGGELRLDYYNSLVMVPWTLDVAEANADFDPEWRRVGGAAGRHLRRVSQVLERLVAPDGSFPPVGRSLCYRCGVFNALAVSALRRELPEGVSPGRARAALTAVIARTLDAAGTFTPAEGGRGGWLTPGLCGRQPSLAEPYVSVGSLYACASAFLPLGLPPEDAFWSGRAEPWTQCRVWSGADAPADHALRADG